MGCPVLSRIAVLVPANRQAGCPSAVVTPPVCLSAVHVKVVSISVHVAVAGVGGVVWIVVCAGLAVHFQPSLSDPLHTHLAHCGLIFGGGLLGLFWLRFGNQNVVNNPFDVSSGLASGGVRSGGW